MEEKQFLLTQLIQLAKSDGDFKQEEHDFILAIAHQLGVSDTDFEQLFNEHIETSPPPMVMDRIVQFQRLVLLMNVDGEVSEKEEEQIRLMGIKMGFRPLTVHRVLAEMKKHPNGLIPPNDLIDIFKTTFN